MSNNEQNRQIVLDYISVYESSPLVFANTDYSRSVFREKEIPSTPELEQDISILSTVESLDELMLRILKLTEKYGSKNTTTGILETGRGRHRSVFDIWRHIKYFKPETTIFEVMRSINLNRESLKSQYCGVVMRRVFNAKPYYNMNECTGSYWDDEFGFTFGNWKTICNP